MVTQETVACGEDGRKTKRGDGGWVSLSLLLTLRTELNIRPPPPPSTGACGPRQATNERTSALCRYPPYGAPPQKDGDQAALTGESSSKFACKTRHGQKT